MSLGAINHSQDMLWVLPKWRFLPGKLMSPLEGSDCCLSKGTCPPLLRGRLVLGCESWFPGKENLEGFGQTCPCVSTFLWALCPRLRVSGVETESYPSLAGTALWSTPLWHGAQLAAGHRRSALMQKAQPPESGGPLWWFGSNMAELKHGPPRTLC